MKTVLPLLLASLFSLPIISQTTDFESFNLPLDTFVNQTDSADSAFHAAPFYFPNNYDTAFGGYWDGWSISTMRDDSTAGYNNQYSAIAGGGKSSDTYMVGYPSFSEGLYLKYEAFLDTKIKFESIEVCNNAYAYYSMLNGDGFAKKFGGSTGEDPDYLILHILLEIDENITDTIDFYLADYTSADSAEDYIVDDWTTVDLSAFDTASYHPTNLRFSFSSSDTSFGFINTPTYVCIDDIQYSYLFGMEESSNAIDVSGKWSIDGQLEINAQSEGRWSAYDLNGRLLDGGAFDQGTTREQLKLPGGIFVLHFETANGSTSTKVWNR